MKKIFLLTLLGFGLMSSVEVYALVEQVHELPLKLHVQRVLATTRYMIFTEEMSRVCTLFPFIRHRWIEAFGVDEIGPGSILREQLKNSNFSDQINLNTNSTSYKRKNSQ